MCQECNPFLHVLPSHTQHSEVHVHVHLLVHVHVGTELLPQTTCARNAIPSYFPHTQLNVSYTQVPLSHIYMLTLVVLLVVRVGLTLPHSITFGRCRAGDTYHRHVIRSWDT